MPTDIAGRKVTLIGEPVQNEVSNAQVAHLSKDLREKGGVKYQLVASCLTTGVAIIIEAS